MITLLLGIYSVLVYYLISLIFGKKMGQCQSYGQLSVVPITQVKESAGDIAYLTKMLLLFSLLSMTQ